MSLGHPIQLRVTLEKQYFYQEEAAKLGKPLATYLRERLESSDDTLSAISSLQRDLASLRFLLEDKPKASDTSAETQTSLVEMLLLLRQLCRPEQVKIAQGELNRLGHLVRRF